jgi:transcriptional regulator with XRE-family HTH domain
MPTTKDIETAILSNIRAQRLAKGYTQKYVGKILGMTQHGYSKLESGSSSITIERLRIIAEVLEVDLSELFIV